MHKKKSDLGYFWKLHNGDQNQIMNLQCTWIQAKRLNLIHSITLTQATQTKDTHKVLLKRPEEVCEKKSLKTWRSKTTLELHSNKKLDTNPLLAIP